MRRWRILVIDDKASVSLDPDWMTPFLWRRTPGPEAKMEQLQELSTDNVLSPFLPGTGKCKYSFDEELSLQINPKERRLTCHRSGRPPIIDVARSLTEAWSLLEDLRPFPPDIVLIDVNLRHGVDDEGQLNAILKEIKEEEEESDAWRTQGDRGALDSQHLKERGGLFLFGKLVRLFGTPQMLPLTIIYSESGEVHQEYRPISYALQKRIEVVGKGPLKDESGDKVRSAIVARRIGDYFRDGRIIGSAVEESLAEIELYFDPQNKEPEFKKKDLLRKAFSRGIGDDWLFCTFFVRECLEVVGARSLESKRKALDTIGNYVKGARQYSRVLIDLFERSPYRLFTHLGDVEYSRREDWFRAEFAKELPNRLDSVAFVLSPQDVSDYRQALIRRIEDSWLQIPVTLREELDSFVKPIAPSGVLSLIGQLSRENSGGIFSQSSGALNEIIKMLRVEDVERGVIDTIRRAATVAEVKVLEDSTSEVRAGTETMGMTSIVSTPHTAKAFLIPRSRYVGAKLGEPLEGLLYAIVGNVRAAYIKGQLPRCWYRLNWDVRRELLKIEIRDEGKGFAGLGEYNFMAFGGDLRTAIRQCTSWFDVEIRSGCVRRNPFVSHGEEIENVAVGTTFEIRLPVVLK